MQVLQPDIHQEAQTAADLLEYLGAYGAARLIHLFGQRLCPRVQVLDIHAAQIGDIAVVDKVTASFEAQSVAMAVGTYRAREKLFAPMTRSRPGIFVLLHLDVLDDTFVRRKVIGCGHCIIGDGEMLGGAVEYIVDTFFAELAYGRTQVKAISFANGFYLPKYHRIVILAQRQYAACIYRCLGIGHNLGPVDKADGSDTFAGGTCTLRRIEGEVVRCRFAIR